MDAKPPISIIKQVIAKFMEDSKVGLALNLSLLFLLAFGLLLAFFFLYLPAATNHSETVTVPDLRGQNILLAAKDLEDRGLRFEVSDSVYNEAYAPNAVVAQYPDNRAQVKTNRKIYLTLNSSVPPEVPVPNVVDGSLKNARIVLQNYGLEVGNIDYVPSRFKDNVIAIRIKGYEPTEEELLAGFRVPKGSRVDLEVGAGIGENEMIIPDLEGMHIAEVETYLDGLGLFVGTIEYVDDESLPIGTVMKQAPEANRGQVIRKGETIDLWVAGYYPESALE